MLIRFCLVAAVWLCCAAQASEPLKLNQLQWIGSHNSYKQALPEGVVGYLQQQGQDTSSLQYQHLTLRQQLDLGLRHLELDVLADPQGGMYLKPAAEQWLGKSLLSAAYKAKLQQPGFKAFHIPDMDFASHCPLFQDCLGQLVEWSKQHKNHLPVVILLNVKESGVAGGIKPRILTAEDYAQLDQEIRAVLPEEKLLTPDFVRKPGLTLQQTVLTHGWPSVASSRGRFIFLFDGQPEQLELYRQQHPSLAGRVMFGNYPPASAEAAMVLQNQPVQQFETIATLVKQGYIVRTRSDEFHPTAYSISRRDTALQSAAQIISTDFYPQAPQQTPDGKAVQFPDQSLWRCHPQLTNSHCVVSE
ncbi:MAG: phosphatidylinositol-specific phospholipase C1-like protein [Gammaproteobacteria bacterium]|nr:phosphatidylinositol-specific phospholipase C1-like protein [Gammaproteobacteria bacterium]